LVTCARSGSITVTEGGSCVLPGDCDGSGSVSIGEVQKAINMFLGTLAPSCCVDANGDGAVSIGEVQKVINAFLGMGPAISVTVSPASASLNFGGTQAFTATVNGTADTAVSWSVQEGSAGGSITQAGLYTAPQVAGTYHVVAASHADPEKKGTAVVAVSGGSTECQFDCTATAPAFGFVGTPLSFASTAQSTHCPGTLTTFWEFGDGGDSAIQNPTHTYASAGQYAWSMVTSMGGLACSRSGVIAIVPTGCGGISVTPQTTALSPFGATAFSANLPQGEVFWKVQEGPPGGSIGADGLYTAPYAAGTYHILATSNSDPSKCGTATITVARNDQVLETKTGSIGSAGGSVSLGDGTSLIIPPGGVSGNTTVTLSRIGNDPVFGDGSHRVFSYTFSAVASGASIAVPVVAGIPPESYAAASIPSDALGIIPLHGAVSGGSFVVDLMGATESASRHPEGEEATLSGRVAVEAVPRARAGSGELLQIPYYEQFTDGACWAAAMLMFCKAYDRDAIPRTVHGILGLTGIHKNAGYSQNWFTSDGFARRVALISGQEIERNSWLSFDNFEEYVLARLGEGKPVLAGMIYHEGVFVGYELDDQDKVTLLYHDPNAADFDLDLWPWPKKMYPRWPYQPISPEDLEAQFWGRAYVDYAVPFTTYVAKEEYQEAPILQTVMMPDDPEALRDGIGFYSGSWHGQFLWESDRVDGYTLAKDLGVYNIRLGGQRVRADFEKMVLKNLPIWNLDNDHAATLDVKTQIFRLDGNAFVQPPLYEVIQEQGIPQYRYAQHGESRLAYSLTLDAKDFTGQLLPSDDRLALQVQLCDGAGGTIDRFDVEFFIDGPFITSVAPSPAQVNAEIELEGFGFGAQGAGKVRFTADGGGTVEATSVLSWGDHLIKVKVPVGAKSGPVTVASAGLQGNAVYADIQGIWDPEERAETSFYVYRMWNGSKQACENFKIQIYRDGALVENGESIARSGLYDTTLKIGSGYSYIVDATYTVDPAETKRVYGSVVIQPGTYNFFNVVSSTATASVAILPAAVTLPTRGSKTFSASVTAAGTQTGISWSVQEAGGGTVNSINASQGSYRAPSAPGIYHVTATSVADPSATASAKVTVTDVVTVKISPEQACLPPGGTLVLNATVTGATNTEVTWEKSGGSLLEEGNRATFTAPSGSGSSTVTARSKADTGKIATATITVPDGSTTTLTFGGTRRIDALTSNIKIAATVLASGTVIAPIVPGGSGQLVVPEWSGEPGPGGGTVMTGCRSATGTVAVSGNATFTPLATTYTEGRKTYTIKNVRYETCWTTDQMPSGGWKMECNQGASLGAAIACGSGSGVFTNVLVDIEETETSESDPGARSSVTYTLQFSGAFVNVDVF
jgi:hypothetical protein